MPQHFGPPLGPGDDDPGSPIIAGESTARPPLTAADGDAVETEAVELPGPLGPGDDDPRSPAKGEAAPIVPVPGPGDGTDPHEGFRMLAPPPAGAGGTDTGPRLITHVPIVESARPSDVPSVAASIVVQFEPESDDQLKTTHTL